MDSALNFESGSKKISLCTLSQFGTSRTMKNAGKELVIPIIPLKKGKKEVGGRRGKTVVVS